MELEFDKEIDAILRKAHRPKAIGAPSGTHLDADAVAAFVENAVPARTKDLYISHLADCDRCRKMLSQSVSLNEPADEVAPVIAAPVAQTVIPWYSRLFRTPGLALAMGALVITFGGLLTYLMVLRGGVGEPAATVSQSANKTAIARGPYDAPASESAAANSNAATVAEPQVANSMSAANNTLGNMSSTPAAIGMSNPTALAGKPSDDALTASKDAAGLPLATRNDKTVPVDSVDAAPPKTAAAAAPPPAPGAPVVTERTEEKKPDTDKKEAESAADTSLAKRKQMDEEFGSRARNMRDMPAAASKSGPARSGPLQSNQIGNQTGEMSVTRSVGGKKFVNRNGAWYDTGYTNQPTQNYRRGTSEYESLDKGLRTLADGVGGTVVLVWKGKAYRIS